ncbi:hypothetical protein BD324DRAFT_654088 [Kockovaella imperatae]|uniref:Transmembrane protein n=1 Tax=Kockovaella imperatae TaxID=4999 RepID=A0A1Y1U640_9TREE|nr:hypothetical protein BD324DRAFT_654088 [Kockovaella imperatae]ORX33500.1 hypothetical protein BD324DRAFT_654088 [Kockovaella imperatae]
MRLYLSPFLILAIPLVNSLPADLPSATLDARDSRPLYFGPPQNPSPGPASPAPPSSTPEPEEKASPSPSPTTTNRTTKTSIPPPKSSSTGPSTTDKSSTASTATTATQSQASETLTTTSSQSTTESTSSTTSTASSTSTSESASQSTSLYQKLKPLIYLSPVFALILISFCGWLYSRWYAHRSTREEQKYSIPAAHKPPPPPSPSLGPGVRGSDPKSRPSSTSIFSASRTNWRSFSRGPGGGDRGGRGGGRTDSAADQWRSGGWGTKDGWKSLHDVDDLMEGDMEEAYNVNGEKLDPADPWYAGELESVVQWQDIELAKGFSEHQDLRGSFVPEDRHGHVGAKQVVFASSEDSTANDNDHDEVVDEQERLAGRPSTSGYMARWRSTLDVWKSARGKPIQSTHRLGSTVKLISGPTYTSLSHHDPFAVVGDSAPTPELFSEAPMPPGWIVPRSTVTSPQLLSPPMQPHLFFHPPSDQPSSAAQIQQSAQTDVFECSCTSDSHTSLCLESSSSSDSSSLLGNAAAIAPITDQQAHDRWPTIPSCADALAQATAYDVPLVMGQYPSVPSTPNKKATLGTPGRMSTMKRSTGRLDLSGQESPTPRRATKSAMKAALGSLTEVSAEESKGTPTKHVGLTRTPTKSRVQRRQDQAQQTVNNILQASWSDRMLAASPPPQSIDGMMHAFSGSASPTDARVSSINPFSAIQEII